MPKVSNSFLAILFGLSACSGGGGGSMTGEADAGMSPPEDADSGDIDADPDALPDAPLPVGMEIVGYAYAGSESAADPYMAEADFSYNAAEKPITITRTGTGNYKLTFSGLTVDGSVVLVSPYGTASAVCNMGTASGEEVTVRCVNPTGNNTDTKFTVAIFDDDATTGATILGFAHANNQASASYTPQASRSYNLGAGTITATRTAVGQYAISFDGLALADIENVQLMPYGGVTSRCTIASWGGTTVNVRCFNAAGDPADSQYVVMVAGERTGGAAKVRAYALSEQENNASYTPALAANEGGGAVTVTRSETGTYSVTFDGRNLNTGAHVQVVSQGTARRCNVSAWAGNTVNLACGDKEGNKVDSKFAIVVLQ